LLGLVVQIFAAMRMQISRDNISNQDVVPPEHFNNGAVAGLYFDDKETVFRIDENHRADHMETSNAGNERTAD
jgi:hypothetical protein